MIRALPLLLTLSILTGCQSGYVMPTDPFPADVALEDCDYPMRESDSDTALGAAYLQALGEIEKCNGRLEGVRKAKDRYLDVAK